MEGQSGLSELSVISWVSAFEGCPLGGVPLYNAKMKQRVKKSNDIAYCCIQIIFKLQKSKD